MNDGAPTDDAVVVIPAGAPIEAAAAWVGGACWAELRFHEVLTTWLGVEADPDTSVALWRVRAHRADLAAQWHQRLPELREMPRPDLVVAGPDELAAMLDRAARATGEDATVEGLDGVRQVLDHLSSHYEAHVAVAVGPADGPVAATLRTALDTTERDLELVAQVSFNRT